MKNRMLKRSHLSEKACREIIQLFADDLTATQIAGYTGISRVTINNYLRLIRTHIARYCAEMNPFITNKDYVPIGKGSDDTNTTEEEKNLHYYGCYRYQGNVFTEGLCSIDKQALYALKKIRMQQFAQQDLPEGLQRFHAVVDFEAWQLYRPQEQNQLITDEIAIFWGNTRNRLLKFRGLNRRTLCLHVKESEFRHNFRSQDINALLLNIIYKHPLHSPVFSAAYARQG